VLRTSLEKKGESFSLMDTCQANQATVQESVLGWNLKLHKNRAATEAGYDFCSSQDFNLELVRCGSRSRKGKNRKVRVLETVSIYEGARL
jgi:hypothetical protein